MARLILSLGGQILAEFNMTKERFTIGRLPDNDVRIDNPAVSGHHSLIINILNDSFLEDLSSTNGTYVNGKLVKKYALQHGDAVTVGHHQLRFVETVAEEQDDEFARTMIIDDSLAAVQQAAMAIHGETTTAPSVNIKTGGNQAGYRQVQNAKVQVLNGKFAGREVELNKALTTLGSPGAQVIAITKRNKGYYVVMLENKKANSLPSINGTPLGSQALKLGDNDVIEVTGTKMGFFSS
ncbi:MAG: FHA domain-containing protein [Gammaproteobacteria bacterium]|nr:FHA domain-containing protein [Gammaproteobacteria bacterium]MCP4091132.1 FHA domain-containing protein [Gammaproteobacteria bacterium]MCP4277342.1 FHA domain-containing protein [Gammaproteobacteria bacterium]MCP4831597.1 FHA domain-containing protein [Gammaproteobacteria bacterium]MCP4927820.1 FHA domain-containing protein [Gammaproteobacteria bacterium]